jgi:hypothetical protein
MTRGRATALVILLCAAVVFLGIEAVEAVLSTQTLPAALRFATVHTVGVVVFGALAVLAVIAAVVLSHRWFVVLIAVCVTVAAIALFFV